ncbi:hypothetical protein LTR08_007531 [Meristemomyces frigidus]|nr:hypothetical protein LTR08_007531 [Meristemomyces frigidus]
MVKILRGSLSVLMLQAVTALVAPSGVNNGKRAIAITLEGASNSSGSITSGAATGMATGMFTALDGGIYEVTSQSGYVVVDGHTLSPGQGALIGNERVTEDAAGFVANGATVLLTPVTIAAQMTTSAMATSSSSEASITMSSSLAPTASAASSASAAAASAASTSASGGAAAPTQRAGNMGWVAAVGGLLGVFVL